MSEHEVHLQVRHFRRSVAFPAALDIRCLPSRYGKWRHGCLQLLLWCSVLCYPLARRLFVFRIEETAGWEAEFMVIRWATRVSYRSHDKRQGVLLHETFRSRWRLRFRCQVDSIARGVSPEEPTNVRHASTDMSTSAQALVAIVVLSDDSMRIQKAPSDFHGPCAARGCKRTVEWRVLLEGPETANALHALGVLLGFEPRLRPGESFRHIYVCLMHRGVVEKNPGFTGWLQP